MIFKKEVLKKTRLRAFYKSVLQRRSLGSLIFVTSVAFLRKNMVKAFQLVNYRVCFVTLGLEVY